MLWEKAYKWIMQEKTYITNNSFTETNISNILTIKIIANEHNIATTNNFTKHIARNKQNKSIMNTLKKHIIREFKINREHNTNLRKAIWSQTQPETNQIPLSMKGGRNADEGGVLWNLILQVTKL